MQTIAPKRRVDVLHLEDDENDHCLVVETLRAEWDCHFALVKSKNEFIEALRDEKKYDLIISDYTLPSYDGLSALSTAQELRPDVPFIFFSGTIGEDLAVESLKH